MNHTNSSMFGKLVDRRRKFAPIFQSEIGADSIHIVVDRRRADSEDTKLLYETVRQMFAAHTAKEGK